MSDTLTHPDEGDAFISDRDAALRRWTHDTPGPITFMLVWERLAIARGIDAQGHAHDSNLLPANREVLGDSLKPREMIELCLAENAERMSGYDARLLRLPALARFALRFIKP